VTANEPVENPFLQANFFSTSGCFFKNKLNKSLPNAIIFFVADLVPAYSVFELNTVTYAGCFNVLPL
jgi:hypothetical protein